jgi:hypothetical protein
MHIIFLRDSVFADFIFMSHYSIIYHMNVPEIKPIVNLVQT